jgi:hypothetical protein
MAAQPKIEKANANPAMLLIPRIKRASIEIPPVG